MFILSHIDELFTRRAGPHGASLVQSAAGGVHRAADRNPHRSRAFTPLVLLCHLGSRSPSHYVSPSSLRASGDARYGLTAGAVSVPPRHRHASVTRPHATSGLQDDDERRRAERVLSSSTRFSFLPRTSPAGQGQISRMASRASIIIASYYMQLDDLPYVWNNSLQQSISCHTTSFLD
ncbi:hypothetical protein BU26DRAFT_328219 [Trematosphaeria pertusa]|uniref:Uncharacterized protein n=1 Tax=Trematosphaeria pertusa TaxID=390896 RepID=A0A6A6IF68_9PLEO|nr:uncharacterized protein BU26DRAFT_328219 [Trematosphaeria pertusa]KAF2248163.1 hypothetical protein BU26DRAFT_328219 [Trematosphaeria pertusa]